MMGCVLAWLSGYVDDLTSFVLSMQCMCSECAKVLQFQTNRCPICRQPVERLLEIKVNNAADD